jgi:plasmid stabilization system protein ParE
MSQAYRLAPLAQQDVEDLVDYIAADDFETALRVEQELTDAFLLIASRPHIGHTRADLQLPPHLRVWAFYSCLIVYRPRTTADQAPVRQNASVPSRSWGESSHTAPKYWS